MGRLFARFEDGMAAVALLPLAVLPILEFLGRWLFDAGIPGSIGYVQHLTLWVGFSGAVLAAREGRHLSLAGGEGVGAKRQQAWQASLAAGLAAAVAIGLTLGAIEFVRIQMFDTNELGGWLPLWVASLIMPVALGLIAIHVVLRAGSRRDIALALLVALVALGLAAWLGPGATTFIWVAVGLLIASAVIGAPIYAVLGGVALLLFIQDFVPIAAIPVETYRIIVSPAIPTIPLFTLAGFVLARGGASGRLVGLFGELFGWLPGGLPIVAILVCAFFTTFTGASGITILALGGLLLPALIKNNYPRPFSLGLLTASGSIGLLFPPSIAVILYAVVARIAIPDMFLAALIPGLIMVVALCLWGVRESLRSNVTRPSFDGGKALAAVFHAKWEILLPILVVVGLFGGYLTLIETASLTAVYALLIEFAIHRDLKIKTDTIPVIKDTLVLVGGIFMILGVAMGMSNYMVDAEIATRVLDFVEANIDSKLVFLLILNVLLLIVGALLDIYSAIAVVVPLLIPLAANFGINPLHLGVIFLANLELGYLTPPVGINLFMSAYRFNLPMSEVYRNTLPMFLLLLVVVLLITYVPVLTLGLID